VGMKAISEVCDIELKKGQEMWRKNLVLALGFIGMMFSIYKICLFLGIPLYPYGMAFFLIPLLGIVPLYQYFENKQINGYKQQLLVSGVLTPEQLNSMTPQEIEMSWRESRQAS